MLYLMEGMPACAQLRMKICNCSMSRSRSGLCGEHDGGVLFVVDVAGLEKRRRSAVDADAVFGGHVDHALELVDGGVEAVALDLRIAADVAHAIASEVLEMDVVGGRALVAELHEYGLGRRCAAAAGNGDASDCVARRPAAPVDARNCLRFMLSPPNGAGGKIAGERRAAHSNETTKAAADL